MSRFALITAEHSNDTWGWNGYVIDRQTRMRHPLVKTVVDYEVDGEIGYATCAFDTYTEMKSAAQRMVNKLVRAR